MASNLKNKGYPENYGPSGALDSTAVLSLNSGTAPTMLEAQGISYTSRGGTGDYTLTLGRTGVKNITALAQIGTATLGVGVTVVVNNAAGTVRVQVFDTGTKAALETTGIQVHLLIRARMNS